MMEWLGSDGIIPLNHPGPTTLFLNFFVIFFIVGFIRVGNTLAVEIFGNPVKQLSL